MSEPSQGWAEAEIVKRNVRLRMVRANLHELLDYPLPDGYGLRWYQRGDEEAWLDIQRRSYPGRAFEAEQFWKTFSLDPGLLGKRQCYLLDAGAQPIGTATAWLDEDYKGRNYGRIHYVAIVPEHQGRGLSKPLVSAVCHRIKDLGHRRAYLVTTSACVPAINLYLAFGFRPDIDNDEDRAAWDALMPVLRSPA